jgi:hypothetical protein
VRIRWVISIGLPTRHTEEVGLLCEVISYARSPKCIVLQI